MKKYEVTITLPHYYYYGVEVDATSEDDAKKRVQDNIHQREYNFMIMPCDDDAYGMAIATGAIEKETE